MRCARQQVGQPLSRMIGDAREHVAQVGLACFRESLSAWNEALADSFNGGAEAAIDS